MEEVFLGSKFSGKSSLMLDLLLLAPSLRIVSSLPLPLLLAKEFLLVSVEFLGLAGDATSEVSSG